MAQDQFENKPVINERFLARKPNPAKAVKEKCLECGEGTYLDIKNCEITSCPLYHFRLGKGTKDRGSRLKAIRKYCLYCMKNNSNEVRECHLTSCPLWIYRFGKNPKLKGKRNIKGNIEALKKWRAENA